MLTYAIEKVLSRFDIHNPYEIDLSRDEPDAKAPSASPNPDSNPNPSPSPNPSPNPNPNPNPNTNANTNTNPNPDQAAVSSEETPAAIDVASLPVVASLSTALKPVLYDQATGMLARLAAGAEPVDAKPAGNSPARKPNLLWLGI